MNVYLAASYGRRVELQAYAADLTRHGVNVTSRWLWPPAEHMEAEAASVYGGILAPRFRQIVNESNTHDLEDIDAADALILFADPQYVRGGKHFETGYAYAHGKRVYVVGEPELTFHFLPGIVRVETWEQCLDRIA